MRYWQRKGEEDGKLIEKFLFLTILIFSIISLLSILNYHLIWWDEAVYIGIGKYLYSNGEVGLFEEIRPLFLPTLLGFFWFINLDPLLCGRILILFSSLLNIYLVYLIGKRLFDSKVGFLSSLILSFTPLFYNYSFLSLTGMFSTTFALISVYFFIQERNLKNISLSTIFLSISFLTRFPQGILLVCFLIFLLYKKEFKNVVVLLVVFSLVTSPYFIFNFFEYGSFFKPLIRASQVITAYKWLYSGSPIFYVEKLFWQNLLFIFAIPGIYYLFKERKGIILFLILVMFLFFFSTNMHKEIRYSLIFLPYLSIISSKGFFSLKLRENYRKILFFAILIFLFLNFSTNFYIPAYSYSEEEIKIYSNFSRGEIIHSTTPIIAYFSDAKVIPMYTTLECVDRYVRTERPEKIFFEDSFPCNTKTCEDKKKNLIRWMKENYNFTVYKDRIYFFTK